MASGYFCPLEYESTDIHSKSVQIFDQANSPNGAHFHPYAHFILTKLYVKVQTCFLVLTKFRTWRIMVRLPYEEKHACWIKKSQFLYTLEEGEMVSSVSDFSNSTVALNPNSLPGANADLSSSAVCVVLNLFFTFRFSWLQDNSTVYTINRNKSNEKPQNKNYNG